MHFFFVDLEKADDRMPRKERWYCMRKSAVAKYERVVKDMYKDSERVVTCAVGETNKFKVGVELQQGSAISPFLFAEVNVLKRRGIKVCT